MKYNSAYYLKYLTDRSNHRVLKLVDRSLINHIHVLVLWKIAKSKTIAKKVYYNQNEFSSIQSFVQFLKYWLFLLYYGTLSIPLLVSNFIRFFFTILIFIKEKSLNRNYETHYGKYKKYVLWISLACKYSSQARTNNTP